MITTHEMTATQADVQNFGQLAMEQFGHLILDEREAKLGMVVVMAAGTNGVFIGEPGGGKTTLAENSYRIISDIDNSELAIIPPESDLKPRQIVGGSSTVTRTVDGRKETIVTESKAIITEESKVIWADEINRVAPHAVNSLLGALASRKFSNTAGEVNLTNLEYAISTMNPGGLNEGVFKVNPANASRHAVGALMGLGENAAISDDVVDQLLAGWRSNPENMVPVTDLHTLHAIRNYIRKGNVAFPQSLRSETVAKIKRTRDILGQNGIQEAFPRLTIHIDQNAKTIAALKGESAVDPESVDQSIAYVVSSRIGMRKANPETEIPKVLAEIKG